MEILAVLIGVVALWYFVPRGAWQEAKAAAAPWSNESRLSYGSQLAAELIRACIVRLVAFVVYAAIAVGLFAIGLGPIAVVLFLVGWAVVAFCRWMKRGYDEERAKPLDVVEFGDGPTTAPPGLRLRDLREIDSYDLIGRKVRWHHVNLRDIGRYAP